MMMMILLMRGWYTTLGPEYHLDIVDRLVPKFLKV